MTTVHQAARQGEPTEHTAADPYFWVGHKRDKIAHAIPSAIGAPTLEEKLRAKAWPQQPRYRNRFAACRIKILEYVGAPKDQILHVRDDLPRCKNCERAIARERRTYALCGPVRGITDTIARARLVASQALVAMRTGGAL